MDKAVIFISGGFDSICLATIFKARGVDLHAITFDYNQINGETDRAKWICEKLDIPLIVVRATGTIPAEVKYPLPGIPHYASLPNFLMYIKWLGCVLGEKVGATNIINGINSVMGHVRPLTEFTEYNGVTYQMHYPYFDEFENNKSYLGYEALATELITADDLAESVSCRSNPRCGKCLSCEFFKEFFEPIGYKI